MRASKMILIAGCLWAAAVTAIWPQTSFSGSGGDGRMVLIGKISRDLSPNLAEGCRTDLLSFASERMRSVIAIGYPSSLLFARRSKAFGERYLASRCPVGPFLAVISLVSEGADDVRRSNGVSPIYARP